MQLEIEHCQKKFKINQNIYFDITIPIQKQENVNCYFLDSPSFQYFESPEFSGNLSKGGSVNCEKISFYPHASGTHTECALHVYPVDFTMKDFNLPALMPAVVLTLNPICSNLDSFIDDTLLNNFNNDLNAEVIVLRTLPNLSDKLNKNYSNTNPTYLKPNAIEVFKKMGFKHIVTDLPSIDKESDEGLLLSHKVWFKDNDYNYNTITELTYIQDDIKDGFYFISIKCPKIQTDAVPSSVVLYPCL